MSDQQKDRLAARKDTVSAASIFWCGGGLFLIALALYVFGKLGPGMTSFIMCVGLGLVFTASGSNADIQAKADGAATAHWLGGFAFPVLRFTGGIAITGVLLAALAYLGPKLVIDADRYTRFLVRASSSLEPYEIWATTDKSNLVGSVRQKGRSRDSRDFEFVAFLSDVEGGATSLELNLKSTNPEKTKDLLSDISIFDVPLSVVKNNFGTATIVLSLDLKTSALRLNDGTCHFDKRQIDPCAQKNGDSHIAQVMEPSHSRISGWIDKAVFISTVYAQTSLQTLTTKGLADLSPGARTQAYSELLAKGTTTFPLLVKDIPELKAQWMADQKNVAAYYQLLGSLNLAVELTNRDQEAANLFRSAIAKSMTKKDAVVPVRALAELANVDDRSIRISATRTLANVIDNNSVIDVLDVLNSGLNDNGQYNLLLTLEPVSKFACSENAAAISARLNSIEANINRGNTGQYTKTNELIAKLRLATEQGQNKTVPCELYWKDRGGGEIKR